MGRGGSGEVVVITGGCAHLCCVAVYFLHLRDGNFFILSLCRLLAQPKLSQLISVFHNPRISGQLECRLVALADLLPLLPRLLRLRGNEGSTWHHLSCAVALAPASSLLH